MHLNPLLISFTFQEAARLRDLLQMQSFDAEAGVLSANNEFYAAFRQLQPACFDVESLWIPLPMFALSSSKIFGPFIFRYFLFKMISTCIFWVVPFVVQLTLSTSVSTLLLFFRSMVRAGSAERMTKIWLPSPRTCCVHPGRPPLNGFLVESLAVAIRKHCSIDMILIMILPLRYIYIYICHIIIFYSYAIEFTSSYTIVF